MFFNRMMIQLIQKYQKSNVSKGRCRHYPCCSNYGIACFKKFSFFKACFLTSYRIIRCNPLSKKVYDPVPLTKKEKQEKENALSRFREIEEILLYHHHHYPQMQLQDDLVILFENTFLNQQKELPVNHIEHIGFQHYRIYKKDEQMNPKAYTLSGEKDSTQLEQFFCQVEILRNLILKKKINYCYSKKALDTELFSYLSGKKAICPSDCYLNLYNTNYEVE